MAKRNHRLSILLPALSAFPGVSLRSPTPRWCCASFTLPPASPRMLSMVCLAPALLPKLVGLFAAILSGFTSMPAKASMVEVSSQRSESIARRQSTGPTGAALPRPRGAVGGVACAGQSQAALGQYGGSEVGSSRGWWEAGLISCDGFKAATPDA